MDGEVFFTDGLDVNLSDRDYFLTARSGKSNISTTLIDRIDGKESNVFATPIWRDHNVVAVLCATHNTKVLTDIIQVSTFNGMGYAYIVDTQGNIITKPQCEDPLLSDNDFWHVKPHPNKST